jgi:hypothetical protein
MNTSLLIVAAGVSACVVLVDARRHAVPWPVLWAVGVLLCWIGVLPAYVRFRVRLVPRCGSGSARPVTAGLSPVGRSVPGTEEH